MVAWRITICGFRCSFNPSNSDTRKIVVATRVEAHVPISSKTMKNRLALQHHLQQVHQALSPQMYPRIRYQQLMRMVIRKMKTRNLETGLLDCIVKVNIEHQRLDTPRNPCCEVCQRSRMYKKRTQSKRYDSLSSRGALPEVTTFGERIACDFIIVSKARTEGRNNVVLVVRDEFSGLMRAFPCGSKSSETIKKHLLAFLGPRFQVAPIEHDEKRSGWRVHCIMFTWASSMSLSLLLRAGGLTTANSRGRFALLKRCREHFIYRLDFIPSKVYGS